MFWSTGWAGRHSSRMSVVGQPAGTVTLVFTDIEGSTRLLQELGRERYSSALTEHRRLVRESAVRHGGVEVEMQGDSFLFGFRRARDAVIAAAEIQKALAAADGEAEQRMRVRVGIHTGEPDVADDGLYVGLDVHRAARIMAAGHGGQVLLSQQTQRLVDGELPSGLGLEDLGEHHLRDVDRSERISQLVVAGLPHRFPPLRTGQGSPARRGRALVLRPLALAGLSVAIVAVGVAGYVWSRGSVAPLVATANSLAAIDPATNQLVVVVPVGT